MYNEKLKPILEDLENKELEIAGGSVVGMVLATTNSLINYICNLTIGKKKYEDVQDEVLKIKEEAENIKKQALSTIDKDKEILEKILNSYKSRKDKPEEYEKTCKESVEFCLTVTENAVETLKLADRISKVGNRMLSSDFEICKLYATASIKASIVNVKINLDSIKDEEYKKQIEEKMLFWDRVFLIHFCFCPFGTGSFRYIFIK